MTRIRLHVAAALVVATAGTSISGCGWRGLNSWPMPGTAGRGTGSYEVQAQLPDVTNLQQNSRVRVGDVTVGNVTKIERQGWHALIVMRIDGDVSLPANTTAKLGQTSLLGSLHIELAPPSDVPPEGRLSDGSVIPLSSSDAFPNTEQTLATLSLLLNGGAIGKIQDITQALRTGLSGREEEFRSLIKQLNEFVTQLDNQRSDIIAATESLNNMVGQFAEQKPVIDSALRTIPDALAVLKDRRDSLIEAFDRFGAFGALTAETVNRTKESLVQELNDIGPVLESLANAGPALTRSLSLLSTFPWPKENITKWQRGDYANVTVVLDLTLSRLDAAMFTGTRFEGDLTELELKWGRTIGQLPSPYTVGNPLIAPYRHDQGR